MAFVASRSRSSRRATCSRGFASSGRSKAAEAHVRLHVTAGPQVELVFMGADPPRRVERTVREQWHKGVFDAQRGDDAADILREWLIDDNHLQRQGGVPDRRRGRGTDGVWCSRYSQASARRES